MTKRPIDDKPKPSSRVARAAEELRANLARRKAQARQRRLKPADVDPAAAPPATDGD